MGKRNIGVPDCLGKLPIIAENLGLITPDVIRLREDFNLPEIRIPQIAFNSNDSGYLLPANTNPTQSPAPEPATRFSHPEWHNSGTAGKE